MVSRKLYFAEGGQRPGIAVVGLPKCKARSADAVVLQTANIHVPSDVALLPDENTLLYSNLGNPRNYIGLLDLPGILNSGRPLLTVGHLFGLDACNGSMYWTDLSSKRVYTASIKTLDEKPLAFFLGYGIKVVCSQNQATESMNFVSTLQTYVLQLIKWYFRYSQCSCVSRARESRRRPVFDS